MDVNERNLGYDLHKDLCLQHGEAPLHIAAELGRIALAELLLDAGADVDPLGGSYFRYTPLSIAAREDNLELVVLLLRHGADPFEADKENARWPYLVAQSRKNDAILAEMDRVLREHGIEPPARRRSPEEIRNGAWRVPLQWEPQGPGDDGR